MSILVVLHMLLFAIGEALELRPQHDLLVVDEGLSDGHVLSKVVVAVSERLLGLVDTPDMLPVASVSLSTLLLLEVGLFLLGRKALESGLGLVSILVVLNVLVFAIGSQLEVWLESDLLVVNVRLPDDIVQLQVEVDVWE